MPSKVRTTKQVLHTKCAMYGSAKKGFWNRQRITERMKVIGLLLGLLWTGLIVSCVEEDQPPVRGKIDYRLLCISSHGCRGFTNGESNLIKSAVDSQEGFFMGCSSDGDKKAFTFYLDNNNLGNSIEINSVPSSKDSPCIIKVGEGKNSYEKDCDVATGGEVDCDQEVDDGSLPCQVVVKKEGNSISGTFCCRNIPTDDKQALGNELSILSSSDTSNPASFEFKYCQQ